MRNAPLGKEIEKVFRDIVVGPESVGPEAEIPDAVGQIPRHCGMYDLTPPGAVFPDDAACLQSQAVPVEKGIEFVE